MPTPALNRNSIILCKAESMYGSDPTPVVATDAVLATPPQISLDAQVLDRNVAVGTLSPTKPVIGKKLVNLSFQAEFKSEDAIQAGSASTPLEIDDILRGAGLDPTYTAESGGGADDGFVTYAPVSSSFESVTYYAFPGNEMRHKVTGAFNNLNIDIVAGQYAMMSVEAKGIYNEPTDTAATTPTYATDSPVPIESIALAFGAVSGVVCRQLSINMNNEIVERADVNSAEGFKGLRLVNRRPTLRFRIEKELAATWNIYNALDVGTTYSTTFTIGSVGGQKILVTVPVLTLIDIKESDDAGIVMLDVEALCARASAGGNDELTMKFF